MPLDFIISGEVCVHKIKALRSNYVSQKDEKCRICESDSYKICDRYISVSKTALPIRQGRYAYINK